MQEPRITEEYVDFEGDSTERPFFKVVKSFFFGPYFVVACLFLVGIISFSLGYYVRQAGVESEVKFINTVSQGEVKGARSPADPTVPAGTTVSSQTSPNTGVASPSIGSGQVVASKNGTKYHLPTCPGAKQISDKNKIIFNSFEEARAAGYSPASNCKGLK